MIYSETDLPQKSDAWLKFRLEQGIGASQVPILLGKYPPQWGDAYQFFLEKMGKAPKEMTLDMERGRFEDQGRQYLTNYYKHCRNVDENSVFCKNVYDRTENVKIVEPNFEQYTIVHKNVPHLFASFDGIDLNNKLVVEIKCPGENVFKTILRNRKPTVPKVYVPQVQTQLNIANSHFGINKGIFAVFHPEGLYLTDKITGITNLIRLILIDVELDREYCNEIEKLCEKFVKMVEKGTWDKNWDR